MTDHFDTNNFMEALTEHAAIPADAVPRPKLTLATLTDIDRAIAGGAVITARFGGGIIEDANGHPYAVEPFDVLTAPLSFSVNRAQVAELGLSIEEFTQAFPHIGIVGLTPSSAVAFWRD